MRNVYKVILNLVNKKLQSKETPTEFVQVSPADVFQAIDEEII